MYGNRIGLTLFICYCVIGFIAIFFFNDTATTEIYTLSLHDALPISTGSGSPASSTSASRFPSSICRKWRCSLRSEEHTSELQSQSNLVCRLLLEKKKKNSIMTDIIIPDIITANTALHTSSMSYVNCL